MGHLPDLIIDLALILIAGSVVVLLFKRLKQPLVLGYIIAGFLVGPHFKLFPTVVDVKNIDIIAELGVIFLLFGLGLEFSFKKLMRVGGSASITAFVEIIFITIAGFLLGKWLGWSTIDSLFLGGMLASSSTTIIIRAFDELGIKTKQFASIVFGVLIVEDIVVILLMVLLSTMAISQQIQGGEILFTVLKLIFFLALWFIMGIFLLPTFLKKAKKWLDDENLLILSLGLCLGMVVLAVQAGFSAELGAFIMGSIIAETTSAEKVEHIIKPIKDLFGAVFFVSVGMLIDPAMIIEHKWAVLAITSLTLFGKIFSTTLGAILSGQQLKQSVQVGLSMAQIGEFAFIVAALGMSLKVTSDFLFPIAVGASAITTFATPYLIKYSDKVYFGLERILPQRILNSLNSFSSSSRQMQIEFGWKTVIAAYAKIIIVNLVILISISLVLVNFIIPYLNSYVELEIVKTLIASSLTLVISAPFIWAIMASKPNNQQYKTFWLKREGYSKGPLMLIESFRVGLGVIMLALWALYFFKPLIALLLILPTTLVIFKIFRQRIQNFYQRIEGRFISNFTEREIASYNTPLATVERKKTELENYLSPYDAHIVQLKISPNASYVGKKLIELSWREQYGINIIYIKRGDRVIHQPTKDHVLLPYDEIAILTSDEQLANFKTVFDNAVQPEVEELSVDDVVTTKFIIDKNIFLNGLAIRKSGLREKVNGLVIGIERDGKYILNPDSEMVFQLGDVVWLIGDSKKIKQMLSASKELSIK